MSSWFKRRASKGGDAWKSLTNPRTGPAVSAAMTLWLMFIWLLVMGSADWLTLLGGLVVVVLVQVLFPLPRAMRLWRIRPRYLAVLGARFVYDLVKAGMQVSWIVLSGRKVDNAIVRVQMRSADPVHMTINSAMNSLVPGSIVIGVDSMHAVMRLHVLDIDGHGGPDGVRASVLDQEKRLLMSIARNRELRALGITPPSDRVKAKLAERAGGSWQETGTGGAKSAGGGDGTGEGGASS